MGGRHSAKSHKKERVRGKGDRSRLLSRACFVGYGVDLNLGAASIWEKLKKAVSNFNLCCLESTGRRDFAKSRRNRKERYCIYWENSCALR